LEDLDIAAGFTDFAELGICSVGVDDEVLTFLLLLNIVAEGRLLLLELVDGLLDAAVEGVDLGRVLWLSGFCLGISVCD